MLLVVHMQYATSRLFTYFLLPSPGVKIYRHLQLANIFFSAIMDILLTGNQFMYSVCISSWVFLSIVNGVSAP